MSPDNLFIHATYASGVHLKEVLKSFTTNV